MALYRHSHVSYEDELESVSQNPPQHSLLVEQAEPLPLQLEPPLELELPLLEPLPELQALSQLDVTHVSYDS
jgi:hypothetical protein